MSASAEAIRRELNDKYFIWDGRVTEGDRGLLTIPAHETRPGDPGYTPPHFTDRGKAKRTPRRTATLKRVLAAVDEDWSEVPAIAERAKMTYFYALKMLKLLWQEQKIERSQYQIRVNGGRYQLVYRKKA